MIDVYCSRRCLRVWGLLLTGLMLGCSSGETRPKAQVQGQVTLDGAPLENASIHFISSRSGETSYTNLQPDGRYQLTFAAVDVGEEYQILFGPTMQDDEIIDANIVQSGPPTTAHIPKKYRDRTTSDLSVTLENKSPQEFNFALMP